MDRFIVLTLTLAIVTVLSIVVVGGQRYLEFIGRRPMPDVGTTYQTPVSTPFTIIYSTPEK